MPLTEPQQKVFDSTARFRTCASGRRGGKTYLAMWEIAKFARQPNRRIMYVAPSYRQAKSIIFEDLKAKLIDRRWLKKVNESELSFLLRNNTRIELRSADAGDSIRGISCDFAVLDECAFFDKSVWTDVIRPTLSDRHGHCLFISTPQGLSNWFYDLYSNAKTLEDWEAFTWSSLEGGQVDAEEIEAAKRDLAPKTFKQEYLASFETTANRIYYGFDPQHNVAKYKGDQPPLLHVGLDLNVAKMVAPIAVKTQSGLFVIDEVVLENTNTDEMAEAIKERYPGTRFVVYPDPAGAARKSSAGGKTDHTILQQWGFTVKARKGHPPVKDRINVTNRLLCNAADERNMFIDPKCKTVIEALNKHQYKAGTNIPEKDAVKGYDGTTDSLGYMCEYLYPLRTEQPERTVKTFRRF